MFLLVRARARVCVCVCQLYYLFAGYLLMPFKLLTTRNVQKQYFSTSNKIFFVSAMSRFTNININCTVFTAPFQQHRTSKCLVGKDTLCLVSEGSGLDSWSRDRLNWDLSLSLHENSTAAFMSRRFFRIVSSLTTGSRVHCSAVQLHSPTAMSWSYTVPTP
jgi:hypothetical protein